MVRRKCFRDGDAPEGRAARSVLFVGPPGRGVGVAADVLADVARLAFRNVRRRRRASTSGIAQWVSYDIAAKASARRDSTTAQTIASAVEHAGIVVAWNRDALGECGAMIGPSTEVVVLDDTVPLWRAGWTSPDDASPRTKAVNETARALGRLSRLLPFTAELWHRALALHLPPRAGDAAQSQFDAARA